jgi:CBS domain-containing protein
MVNEVEQDPGPASHPVSVEDAIRTAVLVRETATLREVASLMLEQQVDNVVVVDENGAVRGVVSDRHLTLNQTYLRLSSIKVPRLHGRWVTSGEEVEAAATTTAAEVVDRRLTTAEVLEPIGSVVERMLRRDAEYARAARWRRCWIARSTRVAATGRGAAGGTPGVRRQVRYRRASGRPSCSTCSLASAWMVGPRSGSSQTGRKQACLLRGRST